MATFLPITFLESILHPEPKALTVVEENKILKKSLKEIQQKVDEQNKKQVSADSKVEELQNKTEKRKRSR